ncbi:TIGR04086 family membrane protein [Intestinibacillus massiliensis]|uniref:TIGR04086 family membrane protein n=1 Tax=Intestinibacillus massiliensis TaxID=1871029 RepID=UPI000B360413|nr:TIGR04086 family membrane protein [Intestinibacillus massiliensis]MCB6367051.1 TIGR04086 family membrane protein [Intestinibacillus massiliensis]
MKKAENAAPISAVLGFPILAGLVLTLLLMLAGALAVYGGKVSGDLIPQASLAALGVGGFVAALLAARRAGRSRLLWGLAAGGILFLCLLLLSLVWIGEPVRLPRVLLVFGVTLVAACAGSITGASLKKSKRKKK